MKKLYDLLNEIQKENELCEKSGVAMPLYRVFIGDGNTGEENIPLAFGKPHPIIYNDFLKTYKPGHISCDSNNPYKVNTSALPINKVVKITRNKKEIWKHSNYFMDQIVWEDKISVNNGERYIMPTDVEWINFKESYNNQSLDKIYSEVRVFKLNKYGKKIYEISMKSLTNEEILKKTECVIKYIQGDRNKA